MIYLENKRISYDFFYGIITIIKYCALIWLGVDFQENQKGLLTSRFASDPILVQWFAYSMVQYVMAGCQNERRRFLNIEKDKKIYYVYVDRHETVGFSRR